MADRLYLSLWYPNFRLESLPAALVCAMAQFARVGGDQRVHAASAIPLRWSEAPTYERLHVLDPRSDADDSALAANAVAEATEQLHDDMAYEFDLRWPLWSPDLILADQGATPGEEATTLDPIWRQQPASVRFVGYGPEFDDAGFEQNGHLRIDFGLDSPFLLEEVALDPIATKRVQQNIEMLLAFTLSIEKHCSISSRLLWTESGEPFAQKLIDRLQRLN